MLRHRPPPVDVSNLAEKAERFGWNRERRGGPIPVMRLRRAATVLVALIAGYAGATACGHDEGDGNGNAGAACDVPDDCYPDADPEEIQGDIMCLDRVPGGYCTHTCTSDADCCAAEGECDDRPQVCAPFESTGTMMCFLSCEAPDVGEEDADGYCHDYASPEFSCRSTGGGSNNRKVCA